MKENLGSFYDKSSDFQQQQFLSLRALICYCLQDRSGLQSLLDIGSGTGARTLQCFELFPRLEKVTAIEPDWEMIAVAQEKYADPRVSYLKMRAEDMPSLVSEKQMFDGVISNWSLHWVSDKEKMMTDMGRMTHAGSQFMFSTCEALPSLLTMIDVFVRGEFRIQLSDSPFFYLNAEEWKDLLTRHGWEILGMKNYPIEREVEDAKKYLDHWFTASTTKFMYGRHLVELPPLSHSDLLWMMSKAFPSHRYPCGLSFSEDVLFVVARKK